MPEEDYEFEPVERFSDLPESQRNFLSAYCQCGQIAKAARHAGINRGSHYLWLNNDAEYEAAFATCRTSNISRIESGLVERLADGWDEPVYQNGELVGYKRKFDHGTSLRYLQSIAPETFKRVSQIEASGNITGVSADEFDAIVRTEIDAIVGSVPSSPPASELVEQYGDLPIDQLIAKWKEDTMSPETELLRSMLRSTGGGNGHDEDDADD